MNGSEKVFISPAMYIQGENVLEKCAEVIQSRIGRGLIVLADETCFQIAGNQLCELLQASGMSVQKVVFGGQSSQKEIDRLTELVRASKADGIVAIGGGKVGDTARGVCANTGVKLCVVPTIAATDAPVASLYAIYTESDTLVECRFTKNPDLVLVDTKIIANAPPRYLASGMADALATWVEASSACMTDHPTTAGGRPTIAALAIAEKCEETIFRYGELAMAANIAKAVTPALDAVVEANILLSGLGYESGGLSAAHAIHDGLTVLHGPIEKTTHGEKVAFGTLAQLFLENKGPEVIDRFVSFYRKIGLPITFKALGMEQVSHDDLLKVGKAVVASSTPINRLPYRVAAGQIAEILIAVNAYTSR